MQLKVIFAMLAICAAPCALAEDKIASSTKPTYFLIDASGSMADTTKAPVGIGNAEVLTTKQNLAESKFKQLLDELPASASVAKSYFQGICGQPIQVDPATTMGRETLAKPPAPSAD